MFNKIKIKKFRLAEDLELKIGKKLTAICGQNGTMKSTLLGTIAQPFGVGRGRKENDKKEKYSECLIVNKRFYANLDEIFKFSENYDLPGEHQYEIYFDKNHKIVKDEIIYENPLQVNSQKRHENEKSKKYIRKVTGKARDKGKGNIQIPVIYLSLSRLYPIGEAENLKGDNLQLSKEEINFLKKNYSEILLSFDEEEYKDNIKLVNKDKISTAGISTKNYDWKTISAGQDNIGKIILSVLEFKRLKDKYEEEYYGGILLIDELEATLYPGAQKKLIEFLNRVSKNYELKIIFTTHSLEIIEELLKNKAYEYDSTLNFLDKSKGKLVNKTEIEFIDVKKNILVQMNSEEKQEEMIKIDIFFEDSEGEYLFKKIVPKVVRSYCNLNPLEIGAKNIALISNKIKQLKDGIVIYDADYKKEKKEFEKNINNHKNSLFFPGIKSLEVECIEILESLEKNDEFWEKCNCNTKQLFKTKKLEFDNLGGDERSKNKKWFVNQRKNFGRDGSHLMNKFKKKYEKEIEKFNNELEQKIKSKFKEIYGITKEKLD